MGENNRGLTFQLEDRRKLGYCDFGNRDGKAILYFHGWPGTRLDIWYHRSIAQKIGARVIALDRPGIGLSDFKKKRSITDYPKDVIELTNGLDIEQFAVLGFSTGGIYALECAKQIPGQLTKIGLVSSLPYFKVDIPEEMLSKELKMLRTIAKRPPLSRIVSAIITRTAFHRFRHNPEEAFEMDIANYPADSQETQAQLEMRKWFFDEYLPELLRQGPRGTAWDFFLLVRWLVAPSPGLKPEDLKNEILLWHGEEDDVVPVLASKQQAEIIPNSQTKFYAGEGHEILYSHFKEILQEMIVD